MSFVQCIRPPGDDRCDPGHGDCSVIDCITTEAVTDPGTGAVIHEAGTVVWHSHMDASIHPEHRLNPHHAAEDHRGKTPVQIAATALCEPCAAHPAARGHFGAGQVIPHP